MTKFKKGDKLRYKHTFIDLTFEVVAIEGGKYFLRCSDGEEGSADYFHAHELLEVAE